MAKAATKALSCTIPQKVYDAIDNHRWDVHMNMSEVVTHALTFYAKAKGLLPDEAPAEADSAEDAPAEDAPVPAETPKPKSR